MDSKLQIISGEFRGRKLRLPAGGRPTQNRARIALFNMLSSLDVRPGRVWDAFAGSGAFGIECLSRWPECSVVFSDLVPGTVRGNLNLLHIGARASVLAADAMTLIEKCGADADLVFVDPPYAAADVGAALVRKLGGIMRTGGIVVWEQDAQKFLAPDDITWEVLRDKQYGRARFLFLRKK
ncbi:MAG: RsmD family RNA methyltransferase [Alphaproteobacteria bacterium]|nr:RsmD family RNA methyltransferase [Alphaproteobacteria bacterium]